MPKSGIKKKKEMRTISNQKYEITDMAHEEYPFLHRIRALRDICGEICAGDIGGFVESESNLSAEPGDCAWIFDDAIAAGDAYVDRDACLRGDAIACGSAYVSKGSVMSGHSRAEDNAYLRGASMTGKALASGNAQIIHDPHTMGTPILSGNCKVYGTVQGGYPHHRFCRDPALRGSPQRYKGYLCPERQEPQRDPRHRA